MNNDFNISFEPDFVGADLARSLSHGERGAVLAKPSLIGSGSRGSSVQIMGLAQDGFDKDTIIAALLLFDRIDCPDNNFVSGIIPPLGLDSTDIWQCSQIKLSGAVTTEFERTALLAGFNELNARDHGRWSLVRNDNLGGLPPRAFGEMTAFQLKLQNALIMPDRSVSFEDIERYKERRRPELDSLRTHIEDIAVEVDGQGFGGLVETHAFEKFMKSMNDYYETMRETNFRKVRSSLSIKFSLRNFFQALPTSFVLTSTSLSAGAAAFLTAGVASIDLEKTLDLKRKPKNISPFEYIYKAGIEL